MENGGTELLTELPIASTWQRQDLNLGSLALQTVLVKKALVHWYSNLTLYSGNHLLQVSPIGMMLKTRDGRD